ncbi:hypothetical protein LSPCS325_00310 [Lysinibacillus sp. CTST325]
MSRLEKLDVFCAKAKRQQQDVFCAKAKRQQQDVFCAKAKRQQQDVFCAKAKRQQQDVGHESVISGRDVLSLRSPTCSLQGLGSTDVFYAKT